MDTFLAEIEAYLAAVKMSASRFGQYAALDRNFVFRLRDGGDCGLRKADEVREWMRSNPQGIAATPEGEAA